MNIKLEPITVMDLPNDADTNSILLEIPEDCHQPSEDKLKTGYLVSLHANGIGLFVATEINKNRRIYPIYPSKENPLRNWKVLEYQIKNKI